jgi:hypothetical protein
MRTLPGAGFAADGRGDGESAAASSPAFPEDPEHGKQLIPRGCQKMPAKKPRRDGSIFGPPTVLISPAWKVKLFGGSWGQGMDGESKPESGEAWSKRAAREANLREYYNGG